MQVEVELRETRNVKNGGMLGPIEYVHRDRAVFFRVPDRDIPWTSWGRVDPTIPKPPLNRTNMQIGRLEAEVLEPLLETGSRIGSMHPGSCEDPPPPLRHPIGTCMVGMRATRVELLR